MSNEPVQVQSTNPASLFTQDAAPWNFPKVSVGVPDPEPEVKKPSFDERLDIIRTSGVIHHLPEASKSQVYKCDEEAIEEYKRRKADLLGGKKRPPPKPIPQQDPLPVDQETLEQVKRMKLEEAEKLPVNKEVEEAVLLEPESQPKRQKTTEPDVKKPRIVVLPPSPKLQGSEELDSSNSSEVSSQSAIASEVEEKMPEEQELDVSSSSNDDVKYLASKKQTTMKDEESSSSSSNENSEVQLSESEMMGGDENSDSEMMGGDESSDSEMMGGDESSNSEIQVGGEDSSSSFDEDDMPPRQRKQTDRYDDNNFPDEDEKKTETPAKVTELKISRSDFDTTTVQLLCHPASRRRNNVTTELPPAVTAISSIEKFKKCGKHLTKFYTTGWCDMVNHAIDIACSMEFKQAGWPIGKSLNPANPGIVNFLCNYYMKHLFEDTDPSQFIPNSDDAEILKCQRYIFVYRNCSMTCVDNGWSKIELWDPYAWALEHKYPEIATLHVKTEQLSAYTALRIALYPHEYAIYRARIAADNALSKSKGAVDFVEFSQSVKSIESFKLSLCNDWSVCCQLADLDIFGRWKQFEDVITNYTQV